MHPACTHAALPAYVLVQQPSRPLHVRACPIFRPHIQTLCLRPRLCPACLSPLQLVAPLVHERDLYLAWSLKRSKAVNGARSVVGVVGKGHLRGVCYALTHDAGEGRGGGPAVAAGRRDVLLWWKRVCVPSQPHFPHLSATWWCYATFCSPGHTALHPPCLLLPPPTLRSWSTPALP